MVRLAGVAYISVESHNIAIPVVIVVVGDIGISGGVITVPQDTLQVVRSPIELLAPLTRRVLGRIWVGCSALMSYQVLPVSTFPPEELQECIRLWLSILITDLTALV